ncbi:MAG: ATP synthase F1 subunit epsilon [Pelagibacteraceae bacterium TMED216]|nr:MAG: ATP synthase F1 subunit epsilon [Pelagibacteraceae bacterium TMED216]|tara:strand:- start:2049 stop:2435 length:387 start_codon:yes stop_codon:yes gene_type:complete
MQNNFNTEIISPNKTLFKSKSVEVIIPAFEGQMTVMENHIPFITFMRPGIIISKNTSQNSFFVTDGIVEFSENNLLVLTSTAIQVDKFEKTQINKLIDETQKKLSESLNDKERFIFSHKLDVLKEIKQ